MRALVLASLLFAAPALAATHLDKFDARAAKVQVTGVSEVPLYRVGEDERLFVRVRVSPEREALFVVTVESAYTISEDLAKELKLKVKSRNKRLLNLQGEDARFREGGEVKQATLKSLELGGLRIDELTVTVAGNPDVGQVMGHQIDGSIGLGAFTNQLAWAVLPGKGVLKVGPSSAGAELVSGVGGQALTYRDVPRQKYKNKVRGYKVAGITQPHPFVVQAAVGGQPVEAALGLAYLDCEVSPALDLGAAPRRSEGDRAFAWLRTTIAGVEVSPTWYRLDGAYTLQLGPELPVQAQICGAVMSGFDLAIDPVNPKIGLAAAEDARPDVQDILLAELAARTAEKPAAPAEEGKEKGKAEEPKKPDAGPWKKLLKAQMSAGRYEAAITSARKLTEFEPRDCSTWQVLGRAQVAAGQLTDAVASLSKASELYHAWWDLPVKRRDEIARELKKLKTDGQKEAAPHKEQPASCYEADGDLALAALAQGDLARVRALYQERTDLDPRVPLAAGNATLRERGWAEAQGPFRAAIARESVGKPLAAARAGVALANVYADNWTAAEPQLQSLFERGQLDLLTGRLWLQGVRDERGQEASLQTAQAMADARPDLLASQILWLEEAQSASDAGSQAQAAARIEALLNEDDTEHPAERRALKAYYLARVGKADEAKVTAEQALKLRNDEALAWLVLADLAGAAGDDQKANALRARAMQYGAANPAYSLIAGTQP